ncbi:MAG TPA: hypothetical protein VEA19_07925 [Actinomycetota bacterium]|nr:hypothetical protein [Actinomycetota bacterium]
MADVATPVEELSSLAEPTSGGRRLWERFSLSVLAFLLLLLAQGSFGILARDYSRTFEIPLGPLVAFLGFATLAGFAAGMAVVLPQRLGLRHPRRGITLAILPVVVTALNVMAALAPGALPGGIGLFTSTYLIGIQPIASMMLGVAVASAFAAD